MVELLGGIQDFLWPFPVLLGGSKLLNLLGWPLGGLKEYCAECRMPSLMLGGLYLVCHPAFGGPVRPSSLFITPALFLLGPVFENFGRV